MERFSIVIPVYNSQDTIKEVVDLVTITMEGLGFSCEYEIILINDCSRDNSSNICKDICKQRSNVKFINLSKNFGQHHALMAGFSNVTGDYVLCLDDDLETPPEEIGKLINKIKDEDIDVVYAQYPIKKHSSFRNIGSTINDMMANYLLDKPKDIVMTSMFITKRYIINEIIKYDNSYPYISGLIFRVTKNIGTVTINHNKRKTGNSNYTFRRLFSHLINGFTNFSIKPLRLLTMTGFIIANVSFILILITIIGKLFAPDMQVGWSSLITVVTFFGGVQLLSIGLVGEYVGRIFMCINKTPQFVIKETANINMENNKNNKVERSESY